MVALIRCSGETRFNKIPDSFSQKLLIHKVMKNCVVYFYNPVTDTLTLSYSNFRAFSFDLFSRTVTTLELADGAVSNNLTTCILIFLYLNVGWNIFSLYFNVHISMYSKLRLETRWAIVYLTIRGWLWLWAKRCSDESWTRYLLGFATHAEFLQLIWVTKLRYS